LTLTYLLVPDHQPGPGRSWTPVADS